MTISIPKKELNNYENAGPLAELPQEEQPKIGRKFDQDKPRWDLLPWDEVEEVVKVLTNGSKKYEDNNWKYVDKARTRYYAAAIRHLKEWWSGDIYDDISKGGDGLHHLAHACCCLLFLMWFDKQNEEANGIIRKD